MNNEKILYEIKAELDRIGQSLWLISKDIHNLVVQILKKSKKDDK